MQDLKNIIESLLFVAEEPLTVDKLKGVLETVAGKEIRSTLQELSEEYDARGGGFRLCEVAGGFQLRSRSEYHEWIKRMLHPSPQRLSKAALETLAVVAYRQPVIRADIEHIRGVDCGGVLRQLMERKLIRVLGRKEIPGRPLIYATTKIFLELFDLKDLKDLPTPLEIEQLSGTPDGGQQYPAENGATQPVALDQIEAEASGKEDTPEEASQDNTAGENNPTIAEPSVNTDDQQTAPLASDAKKMQAATENAQPVSAPPDGAQPTENDASLNVERVIEDSPGDADGQKPPDDLKNT